MADEEDTYMDSEPAPVKEAAGGEGDVLQSEDRIARTPLKLLESVAISREDAHAYRIIDSLTKLYQSKVVHIERLCKFNDFYESWVGGECAEQEFSMKPTIFVCGAYSTGKTTFIRNLLGKDFLDMHIGPEPTTDRFDILIYGREEIVVGGDVVVSLPHLPFSSLSALGLEFVNKMVATTVNSPILRKMNIIDSPGVLSGQKQTINRGYSYSRAARWFAQRSDIILLIFDTGKTDISDELKSIINEMFEFHGRFRIILNKVDMIGQKELVRVYGSLMWSIGRIIPSPEVSRIYLCSQVGSGEFAQEDNDAIAALVMNVHKNSLSRKVGSFFKRVRLLRAHILVLLYLKKRVPWVWGIQSKKLAMTRSEELRGVYRHISLKYDIPESDFPPVKLMSDLLSVKMWSNVPVCKRHLHEVQGIIKHDLTEISSTLVPALNQTNPPRKPTRRKDIGSKKPDE